MRQKLHRGRRPVFRKRNPVWRILGVTVTVLAIVAGGFFGAKFLTERPQATPDAGNQQPTTSASTTTTTPTKTDKPESTALQQVRGFYLPHSMLSADTLSEVSLLAEARESGYNAVIFDLKDTNGKLYYKFSNATAKKVGNYAENALTKEQLTTLFNQFKEAGLAPIPRLYGFRDNAAAQALPEARIAYKGNASWSWYDGENSATSSRWLSPYDNDAHDYLGDLAEELKKLGAGAVLFDGVEFPNPRITGMADFGSDNADLKWDEVLALFVSKMKKRLGDECPVILACSGESALGTATQTYGGNPLTFAPTMAAPSLNEKVQESVEAMILRTKVLDEEDKPTLSPMLEIGGVSAKQIKQMIAECVAGGADSYILYNPKGNYDFSAY